MIIFFISSHAIFISEAPQNKLLHFQNKYEVMQAN